MWYNDFTKKVLNMEFGLGIYPTTKSKRILILSDDKNTAMKAADTYKFICMDETIIDWIEVDENQPDVVLKWIADSDILVIVRSESGIVSEKIQYDIAFARRLNKYVLWYAPNNDEEDPVIEAYRSIADRAYEEEKKDQMQHAFSGGCVASTDDVIEQLKPHCCYDIKDSYKYSSGTIQARCKCHYNWCGPDKK